MLDDTFEYLGYSDNLAYTSGRPDLTTNWRCRVVPGSGFPDHAGGRLSLFSWCTKCLNSAEHKRHFVKVSQPTGFWKLDLLVVWTQGQHVPHRINQSQTLSIYLSNANQGFLFCSMSVRQKRIRVLENTRKETTFNRRVCVSVSIPEFWGFFLAVQS